MDYRIFIVHTDVDAYDCSQGCMDTEGVSALKVALGRESLAALENGTCISGVTVRCSNQQSHIPVFSALYLYRS